MAEQLEERWHEKGEVVVNLGRKMDRFGVALEGSFEEANTKETVSLPSPAEFWPGVLGRRAPRSETLSGGEGPRPDSVDARPVLCAPVFKLNLDWRLI